MPKVHLKNNSILKNLHFGPSVNPRYQHISADEFSRSRIDNYKTEQFWRRTNRDSLNVNYQINHLLTKVCMFITYVLACINCLKRGPTVAKYTSSKFSIYGSSLNSLVHRYYKSAIWNNNYTEQSSTLHGLVNYYPADEFFVRSGESYFHRWNEDFPKMTQRDKCIMISWKSILIDNNNR